MILSNADSSGFYEKSEYEFLGREINYKFMTARQLDNALIESMTLYNKMFPIKKTKLQKAMKAIITVGLIVGTVGVVGAAIIASYGIPLGTALGTMSTAATATVGAGSTLAEVQSVATGVSVAGGVYAKVTGDTPSELLQAADFIKSPTALDAMEKAATTQLNRRGATIQRGDKASNAALKARLKIEQQSLSNKLTLAANQKAAALGQSPPQKKEISALNIVMVATPFLLYFLG